MGRIRVVGDRPAHPFLYPDVQKLLVHDDGTGPALYAAGSFSILGVPGVSGIAKWDGSAWSPVGSGFDTSSQVGAMTVFDDGSGPALFLGGSFDSIGGIYVHGLAKWDGSSWSGLGGVLDGHVGALAPFDDGTRPALYVGGDFTTVRVCPRAGSRDGTGRPGRP
jgi:hypothetical protein